MKLAKGKSKGLIPRLKNKQWRRRRDEKVAPLSVSKSGKDKPNHKNQMNSPDKISGREMGRMQGWKTLLKEVPSGREKGRQRGRILAGRREENFSQRVKPGEIVGVRMGGRCGRSKRVSSEWKD